MRSPAGSVRLPRLVAPALLLAALGCGDGPQEPSRPEAAALEPAPALAAAALAFRQISTGGGHTCGVTFDDVGYCWGVNRDGQIGNGNTAWPIMQPVPVGGGLRFRTVMAGANHTCGVTTAGKAWCWGSNFTGQLGNGTISSAPTVAPVAVHGGLTFRNLSTGRFHTCGVTTDDRAYCWGFNFHGELGTGTPTDISINSPVAVTGGVRFRLVTVGDAHTCGISTADRAYCWGDNGDGQLGDSSNFTSRAQPVRIAGGRFYQWLDAGSGHTCGVTTDGRAFCWGNGRNGQLGNGKTNLSFWPRRVGGSGLLLRNITAGTAHSCGVATDGKSWCWGDNRDGGLGDGTTTLRLTPVRVTGGIALARMSAGNFFTCGLTEPGKAYCWGTNPAGQVGDGTVTTPRLTPTPVLGPQ